MDRGRVTHQKSAIARLLGLAVLLLITWNAGAQAPTPAVPPLPGAPAATTTPKPDFDPMSVLSPRDWQNIDQSCDRALAWLASQQADDGSFPTYPTGQPGVTSLCVMAFLSRGHQPGEGPYGERLTHAIDFILSSQQSNGLITREAFTRNEVHLGYIPASHTAAYNHAVSGVLLCEAYGMTGGEQAKRIRQAIERALSYTSGEQKKPKRDPRDTGGWRYAMPVMTENVDSDLSITSWQLMFLRAAKNAGFAVTSESIDQAVEYVKRCFRDNEGSFVYGIGHIVGPSRAMAGAGILSLSLSGLHDTPEARASAEWLIRRPYDRYVEGGNLDEHFHYGVYYCTLAMFQLGGRYWQRFFPIMAGTMMANQNADGSWQPEGMAPDVGMFGQDYTTALTVIALSVANQLLPIYQR